MVYELLSESVQNIILYNYEANMKALFVFVSLSISFFYLFIYKPNYEKKSPFWSSFYLRIVMTAFSFFLILLSPIYVLALSPTYTLNGFLGVFLMIYLIISMVYFFIILIDFIKNSFLWLINISGIDIDSENYRYLKNWIERYLR